MKRNAETGGKHLSKSQHEAVNAAAGKTAKGAEPNKKKRKTKVLVGFIMLLIIIALIAFLVADHYLDKINRENAGDVIGADDETFDGDGDGGLDPDDVAWGKVDGLDDDDLINILLVGQDRRPGQGRQRSDTMLLVSVNPKTKDISIISFLRDLYVQFPGDYSDNRLNAAYAFGGFDLLTETLELNFGVTVDGCFEVDFDGFTETIDILGGVDMEITAAEAREMNKYCSGGVTAGMQHLDGERALAYARIRYIDNDFGRTERQRELFSIVFDGLKGCSLKELNKLANKILPLMTTNMSNSEIMKIIAKCYKAVNSDLKTYHVPGDDAYYNAMIRGMAVLVPDLPLIRQQLETYLPLTK